MLQYRILLVQKLCSRKMTYSNSHSPLPHSTWLDPTGFLIYILLLTGITPEGNASVWGGVYHFHPTALSPGTLETETFHGPFSGSTVVIPWLFLQHPASHRKCTFCFTYPSWGRTNKSLLTTQPSKSYIHSNYLDTSFLPYDNVRHRETWAEWPEKVMHLEDILGNWLTLPKPALLPPQEAVIPPCLKGKYEDLWMRNLGDE